MFHMSRLRFIEPQLASPVDQPPEGKHGFTKLNTMAPALYPNALYCDCGKCSAVEDTMTKGGLALVVDKWDARVENGDTLVEYAGRGLGFPEDYAEEGAEGSYVGTYTYKPDGSWTGAGTGIETFTDGTTYYTWEESSENLTAGRENTYKYTGGTGKYKGASGDGTYTLYEGVSGGYIPGTLQRCKYNDKIVLP
jgi:hypothetical protein